MTRPAAALLAIALAAPAAQADQHGDPPGPGWERDGISWLYRADRERIGVMLPRSIRRVADYLDRFANEPGADCGSRELSAAHNEAVMTAGVATTGGSTFKENSAGAGLLLDVADAAADRGCGDVARRLYRAVLGTYTGFGYAAHRQRAEVGLAELRAAGR